MSWRLAKSLVQLREQINAASPDRSKVSDGSIGDQLHSARASDHNPNAQGVVTAIDVTHDPAHGVDGTTLAEKLILDPRAKYVIFAGQIWKARTGKWEAYHGMNSHHHHVHVSVKAELADDASIWFWPYLTERPTLKLLSTGQAVRNLQYKLRAAGYSVAIDGSFGKITESNLQRFQEERGLPQSGMTDSATWAALESV